MRYNPFKRIGKRGIYRQNEMVDYSLMLTETVPRDLSKIPLKFSYFDLSNSDYFLYCLKDMFVTDNSILLNVPRHMNLPSNFDNGFYYFYRFISEDFKKTIPEKAKQILEIIDAKKLEKKLKRLEAKNANLL